MTPVMVSGIVQTTPPVSNVKVNTPGQEEKAATAPNAGLVAAKASKPEKPDTVSISSQSQQSIINAKKEEAKKETSNTSISNKFDLAAAKVVFTYDQNGELITKYMDSAKRLIYQVPTRLALFMKENASKSESSVDTKI